MRPFLIAALFLSALAGCAEEAENAAAPAHPNLIIVRDFAAPVSVVTLDPSFGFSLHRGTPGVPPVQRAGAVARAASFTLADTIVEQLRALGYDAVRSNQGGPEPGGRALVVSGVFRSIDEGYRRHAGAGAGSVAVQTEIDYAVRNAAPRRLMTFPLDSRQVPQEGTRGVAARREPINAAAARVGSFIARTVAQVAHRSNWPGAPR